MISANSIEKTVLPLSAMHYGMSHGDVDTWMSTIDGGGIEIYAQAHGRVRSTHVNAEWLRVLSPRSYVQMHNP